MDNTTNPLAKCANSTTGAMMPIIFHSKVRKITIPGKIQSSTKLVDVVKTSIHASMTDHMTVSMKSALSMISVAMATIQMLIISSASHTSPKSTENAQQTTCTIHVIPSTIPSSVIMVTGSAKKLNKMDGIQLVLYTKEVSDLSIVN